MANPEELVRVVAGPEGNLLVGRNLPGRGAWVCAGSASCIDSAARRNAFSRALRTAVSPAEVAALREDLSRRGRMEGVDGLIDRTKVVETMTGT